MFSLKRFVDRMETEKINMDAVLVIQDNERLGLHRFHDNTVHNVFSVAKSFTSTAIGMAVDEGLLSLTDKPYEMFKDILPDDVDPRWKDVTLYNLLTMTSGHGQPHLMVVDRKWLRGETDRAVDEKTKNEWLHFAFSCPMKYQPGEKMSYGNLAPYVAGRMLEKACGCSINDYLDKKLWQPLGIEKPRWDSDCAGHTFAASDLYLDIEDMGKLGQIYLNQGVFNGRRYLSSEWIEKATSNHVESTYVNPIGYAKDEVCGYGFYFWHNSYPGSYRAYGREGQFIIVIPDKNAVIATQAMHSDVQPILDAVWEEILPAL